MCQAVPEPAATWFLLVEARGAGEIHKVAEESTRPRLQLVVKDRRIVQCGILLGLRDRYFCHPPAPFQA